MSGDHLDLSVTAAWKDDATPDTDALLRWSLPNRRSGIAVQFERVKFRSWRAPTLVDNQSWRPRLRGD